MKSVKTTIPSVNFHLWQPCNMRCKFCFAAFMDVKKNVLPKGHLPKEKAKAVIQQLAEYGFQKITFAGGEPLLCPWLPELIRLAKLEGLTTMIVTNGSKLTNQWLTNNEPYLDWITISIDSLNELTNLATGRAIIGKRALSQNYYMDLVKRVKKSGYRLKINTVISSKNFHEDMSEFILKAMPERWKIFQALPMKGQNDTCIDKMKVTKRQFHQFIERHQVIASKVTLIPEDNKAMTNSYIMIDPAGRFYDNSKGEHTYSQPILKVGIHQALSEVTVSEDRFLERGGLYDWKGEALALAG